MWSKSVWHWQLRAFVQTATASCRPLTLGKRRMKMERRRSREWRRRTRRARKLQERPVKDYPQLSTRPRPKKARTHLNPSISPAWSRSILKPMAARRSWHQTAPWSVYTPQNLIGSVDKSLCSKYVLCYCVIDMWLLFRVCRRRWPSF